MSLISKELSSTIFPHTISPIMRQFIMSTMLIVAYHVLLSLVACWKGGYTDLRVACRHQHLELHLSWVNAFVDESSALTLPSDITVTMIWSICMYIFTYIWTNYFNTMMYRCFDCRFPLRVISIFRVQKIQFVSVKILKSNLAKPR